MQCLYPHTMHRDGKNVTVSCRKCMPCRVKHAQDWAFRIGTEHKVARSAIFLTLTYSDDHILRNDLGHGVLNKKDMQLFFKRLRKSIWTYERQIAKTLKITEYMKFPSVKYYACGEYGGETFRPHYHAIIFNIPAETLRQIETIWNLGFVKIETVTEHTILYVTKYITKVDTRDLELRDLTPPFNLMSKGLGASYINEDTHRYHQQPTTKLSIKKQYEQRLPKYYHDKFHDMENFETKHEIKHYKAKQAYALSRLSREKDQELIKNGVDLGQYDAQKRRNIETIISKNNKRNKL